MKRKMWYAGVATAAVKGAFVKRKVGLIAFVATTMSTVASSETLSNETVVSLVKAGLSEGLVVDKINSEPCGYDVSTASMIQLKQSGLSDGIIAAMVRRCTSVSRLRGVSGDDTSADPRVKHSPGIYVVQDWQASTKLQVLRPSKSSGTKTSGNGSILFPLVAKMIVPGQQGHVPVQTTNPIFYFYFNVTDSPVSDFGAENSVAAQSPDEFSLVKFKQKADAREVEFGRVSAYGGTLVSMKKGVDTKNTIKFEAQDLGDGVFKVSASQPLEAGEYAFIFTGASGSSRIYDFSVITAIPTQTASRAN